MPPCLRGSYVSPEPQELPPAKARRQPDRDVRDRHEEADSPPLTARDVAGPEQDGTGRRAVMRQAGGEVRQAQQVLGIEARDNF